MTVAGASGGVRVPATACGESMKDPDCYSLDFGENDGEKSTELFDTAGMSVEAPDFSGADSLSDSLDGVSPCRDEASTSRGDSGRSFGTFDGGLSDNGGPEFGLTTGAFRNRRSGRFVDGRPPESYDGTADRFREKTGEFETTPDPVERRRASFWTRVNPFR